MKGIVLAGQLQDIMILVDFYCSILHLLHCVYLLNIV